MGESASPAVQPSSQSRLGDRIRREVARDAALVGLDPVDNVVMMEDHDGAYYAWKQAGFTGRVLLHIDAHIDWSWIADKNPLDILEAQSLQQLESILEDRSLWNLSGRRSEELVHIGNYIYPALQEGIVKEFFWVVPDSFTENRRELRGLVQTFEAMRKVNPQGLRNIRLERRRVVAEISGRTVMACSLSDLPAIQESVLLDIDTDFLMRDPVESCHAGKDPWRQLPWLWPGELVARLNAKEIRTDFVTIAYSVEGGFTPLPYKYLGDELALRLKHPQLPERDRMALAHKQQAADYRHAQELEKAIAEFEQASTLVPEDGSAHFNLAYLYAVTGATDQAAARYRRAVQLDPAYKTAYNNFGFLFHSMGMLDRAGDEYQRMLRWDPQNADTHYGLAEVLAAQQRWDEAMRQYQTVQEITPDHAGALRGLGFVNLERMQWEEAITQFRRCVALKPNDGFGHFWLGEALLRQRRWDKALEAYKAALRYGVRSFTIHRRLGDLYLRKRKFYKALKQYQKVLRVWGWRTLFSIRERSRTLFEKLSPKRQPCSR
jgi:tetratricopeptide (TPR) repeat protein